MSEQSRIYVVMYKDDSKPRRLVEARSREQAIRHVVKQEYSAKAANPREVAKLMCNGTAVERASETPEEQLSLPIEP